MSIWLVTNAWTRVRVDCWVGERETTTVHCVVLHCIALHVCVSLPGDRILRVNGISLVGVSHYQAVEILRSTPPTSSLQLERSDPPSVSPSIVSSWSSLARSELEVDSVDTGFLIDILDMVVVVCWVDKLPTLHTTSLVFVTLQFITR